MKYILLFTLLTSCGVQDKLTGDKPNDPENHDTDPMRESDTRIPGPVGPSGPSGPAGRDGNSCTVTPLPNGSRIECSDGTSSTILNGDRGIPGPRGPQGDSCTVERVSNGATISCTDGTSVVVLDGIRGADGTNAPPTPYTVTEFIDPCGDQPGFDEILMRLSNGQVVAHYSDGVKQFLTTLSQGSYTTTDAHACHFTVNADMSVSW